MYLQYYVVKSALLIMIGPKDASKHAKNAKDVTAEAHINLSVNYACLRHRKGFQFFKDLWLQFQPIFERRSSIKMSSPLRAGRQLSKLNSSTNRRSLSTSSKMSAAAEVKRLGVVGAGQMVGVSREMNSRNTNC